MEKLTQDEIVKTVRNLIGPIEPVGESRTDETRYENLLKLIECLDVLLQDVFDLCSYQNSGQYSVARAGKEAEKFKETFRDLF